MCGHELLEDFSRGNFDEWINNIVSATIEKCNRNLVDIAKCLRTQTETTIQLDTSKEPVATPIKDATGNIRYAPINPLDIMDWEFHQRKYNQQKQH